VACEAIRLLLNLYHRLCPVARYEEIGGLKLKVFPGVFDPKHTISAGLLMESGFSVQGLVVDVGSGSGVLSLALARHADEVISIDIDYKALQNVMENAKLYGLSDKIHVVAADIGSFHLSCKCDAVVSNPPYLPLKPVTEIDKLWCAGEGLEIVRSIITFASKYLKEKGLLKFTSSSLSLQWVKYFLEKNKFSWSITAMKRTPLDTIYVIEARR